MNGAQSLSLSTVPDLPYTWCRARVSLLLPHSISLTLLSSVSLFPFLLVSLSTHVDFAPWSRALLSSLFSHIKSRVLYFNWLAQESPYAHLDEILFFLFSFFFLSENSSFWTLDRIFFRYFFYYCYFRLRKKKTLWSRSKKD